MPLQMLARGAAAEGKVHPRDAFRPLWPQAVIAIELSGQKRYQIHQNRSVDSDTTFGGGKIWARFV
jgi:hypothetical protein